MDDALIDDVIFIPNGINQWNRERYEITGYINNVNTQYTQVLMEYGPSGYGNIYEYGAQRNSLTNNGKTSYYAYDGRGSVSELLSPSGNPQLRYSYGAFGQTTTTYLSYVDNPYRYNSEYVDAVPGVPDMQYLRARYYAPHEGRFFTQDTVQGDLRIPLSQNLYLYCRNNGVMFIDPSGHMTIDIPLSIRMAGEAAISSYLAGMEKKNNTTYQKVTSVAEVNQERKAELTKNLKDAQSSGASPAVIEEIERARDSVYDTRTHGGSGSGSSGSSGSQTVYAPVRLSTVVNDGGSTIASSSNSVRREMSSSEQKLWNKIINGQALLSEKLYFEQVMAPKLIYGYERALPKEVDGTVKRYEDFRKLSDINEYQYKMQQHAYTDELGFRRVNVPQLSDSAYMVAVGSFYTKGVRDGMVLHIEQENGYNFYAVVGDSKADRDTNSTNQYTYAPNDNPKYNIDETNADIIEFIMDTTNKHAHTLVDYDGRGNGYGTLEQAPAYKEMLNSPITKITELQMPTYWQQRGDGQ